ncbi:hypothetical protein MMC25_002726 [Agyrium rufum]|nr:hypothetical protein [Agyrium rufum]
MAMAMTVEMEEVVHPLYDVLGAPTSGLLPLLKREPGSHIESLDETLTRKKEGGNVQYHAERLPNWTGGTTYKTCEERWTLPNQSTRPDPRPARQDMFKRRRAATTLSQ